MGEKKVALVLVVQYENSVEKTYSNLPIFFEKMSFSVGIMHIALAPYAEPGVFTSGRTLRVDIARKLKFFFVFFFCSWP